MSILTCNVCIRQPKLFQQRHVMSHCKIHTSQKVILQIKDLETAEPPTLMDVETG